MYRKRLAAFIMTGCLLTSFGCSSTGSGSSSGLFSGCCGHSSSSSGGGVLGRMFGSNSAPAVASAPVVAGGIDCPCSHQGGEGMFHPAVMSQGVPSGAVMGDMGAPQGFPTQPFPGQSVPVTTPGVPPNMNFPSAPGQPPRIQPVPMAPSGVAPSAGMAPPVNWVPQ